MTTSLALLGAGDLDDERWLALVRAEIAAAPPWRGPAAGPDLVRVRHRSGVRGGEATS